MVNGMKTSVAKVDYKKELKELYAPSAKAVSEVLVPEMQFLMIDGEGDPGSSKSFERAMEALYPLAYSLKFMCKLELGRDFVVMPLEGLWWADDMDAFVKGRRDEWKWTLLMMQPEFVTQEMFAAAVNKVRSKQAPEDLDRVRLERYDEGSCVQVMHLGPFSEEGPAIQRLHDRIDELGGKKRLRHHEIYLSDPRRVSPEKLRTVLRQAYEL